MSLPKMELLWRMRFSGMTRRRDPAEWHDASFLVICADYKCVWAVEEITPWRGQRLTEERRSPGSLAMRSSLFVSVIVLPSLSAERGRAEWHCRGPPPPLVKPDVRSSRRPHRATRSPMRTSQRLD